jgi:hypothetical protein
MQSANYQSLHLLGSRSILIGDWKKEMYLVYWPDMGVPITGEVVMWAVGAWAGQQLCQLWQDLSITNKLSQKKEHYFFSFGIRTQIEQFMQMSGTV